jgi:catechol 2,3-dioxygenase-like lactoylglutathione lyase family enzyme
MVPLRMTKSNVIHRIYDGRVIDHFGINCANWDESKAFYDKVLGVLGYTRQMDFHVAIGYGKEGKPDFWIADMAAGEAAGPNREVHFAFQAADTDAVQAFYDTAIEAGAETLHAPRLWPEYHPGYFGAFVRDPDGNNIEAVFHGAQPTG